MKLQLLVFSVIVSGKLLSQDSLPQASKKISLHWQGTVIPQYHFNFQSPYSGINSFEASEPAATSISTTAYLAYKPFKNTYLVFNPEAAGGKGLSKTQGIAGFPNGEVYRVGNPKLSPFIARLYVEQRFPLISETTNKDYISLIVGKFSLTDFFDDTQLSNDPRTQFFNWSLFGNGAWDYPANTRGYTMGLVAQLFYKGFTVKYANAAVPTEANGSDLVYNRKDAVGRVIEFGIESFRLGRKKTATHYHSLRIGLFSNKADMGDYAVSIATSLQTLTAPDITDSRVAGRKKSGYYISLDNHMGKVHHFIKHSYNDGDHESWAFTEIDKSVATGFRFDGSIWKRNEDALGVAYVRNDLSSVHKQYLQYGGYGFIIGDGKLNYGTESILEIYYSFHVYKKIFLSPDYQFVANPGYNKDRGPVHLIAARLHIEL
jgi:high affinity Mn2+ porin